MSEVASEPTEESGLPSKNRMRLWVLTGIVLCVLIGWALMLVIVRGHVAGREGFAALGPGMELVGQALRLMGVDATPTGLWRDICRAFAVGSGTQSGSWSWQQTLLALLMWQVMALAMMLPTAAPFIATYGDISQVARDKDMKQPGVIVFIAG